MILKFLKTGAKYWTSFGLVIYGVNHPESRFSMTLANPKEDNYIFGNGDQIRYEGYNSSIVFSLDPNNTSNSLIITRYDGNIMYLLDVNGNIIASNDDLVPLCSTLQASMRLQLVAGTYGSEIDI